MRPWCSEASGSHPVPEDSRVMGYGPSAPVIAGGPDLLMSMPGMDRWSAGLGSGFASPSEAAECGSVFGAAADGFFGGGMSMPGMCMCCAVAGAVRLTSASALAAARKRDVIIGLQLGTPLAQRSPWFA